MPLIPFARQSRPGAHSGERLLNYFLNPTDGATSAATWGRTGVLEYADTLSGVHDFAELGTDLFAITTSKVWKITTGTPVDIGTMLGGDDVRVAASGTEIAIITGGRYYVCDGSTTTEYSTGVITAPVDVAFLKGYFVVIGSDGQRDDAMAISALDDATTFDALDYVYAESSPDALVAVTADHGEIWLHGGKTTEVYYNSGNATFPFEPTNSWLQVGCANGKTVAQADNSVFWVGDGNIVYRASGAAPQVISTREIEDLIGTLTIDQGFIYFDRGHVFYVLHATVGPSPAYNLTTGLWCEFSTGADHDAWIVRSAYWFNGRQYLGTTTGKVGTSSGYSDDGAVIRAEMVTMAIVKDGNIFPISKIHLNVDTGRTDFDRTPKIALEMSRDGSTFTAAKWRDLAGIGNYMKRATWYGLGAARWQQAKIWITDEVKRDIIGGVYQ